MVKDDLTPGIIVNVDQITQRVQAAQQQAEMQQAQKKHAVKMAKYREWVDPKAIADRVAKHEAEAAAALERGKAMSQAEELLPVPDPLPRHMVGQSPSTIQAMLRHERGNVRLERAAVLIAAEPEAVAPEVVPSLPTPVDKPWKRRFFRWFEAT
jgi:hypothetical protein